jgi:hypothetical protein
LKAVFTIFFSLVIVNLFAQREEIKREIKYTAEIGTILSTTGETPFWLRANQYGIVPSQSPILTLRGSISSDYKKAITKEDQYKLSKFDWGYGLNVVGNVGKENQVLIPEAYVKAKYGVFEIYAGRRKEIVGLVDTTLSSGSYIWSGNALPMPKIQISTPNFVPLGFTKGFLSFKGSYAHGWFENSRTDVKNFYLHQKSLYFRLGKPDWKFHFYGGFNHQVQWGGELLYEDLKNQSGIDGKVGSSFNDYINVILGRSLAAKGDTSKVGGYEATNRSGNHLGTLDFGFNVIMNSFSILFYRQNIFEDGSLAYLGNITDGLNGVSIISKKKSDSKLRLQKVVFEYLNTSNQGGATGSDNINSRLRGGDNYFNNGVYRNGWSYNQTSIGTGFINNNSSITANASNLFFNNNRVEVFYLGIFGIINNSMNSEIRISNSKNNGTYLYPLVKVKSQFSGLISLNYCPSFLENSVIKLSVAMDNGELYNDNYCFHLGLKKSW